jgi:large subunit ribosomal protein L4
MATITVLNQQGQPAGDLELVPSVFEAEPRVSLVHQVVVAEQAALRQGTHKVKTRAEVSGGGKKPWRQKGTGRARQGSTRSPHWRHGGVVHGPQPRDHSVKINRKMVLAGIRCALSARTRDNALVVVDALEVESGKTRDMVRVLNSVKATGKVLIIVDTFSEPTILSLRNLPNIVDVTTPYDLSVYDLLNANVVLATKGAVEAIGEAYAK